MSCLWNYRVTSFSPTFTLVIVSHKPSAMYNRFSAVLSFVQGEVPTVVMKIKVMLKCPVIQRREKNITSLSRVLYKDSMLRKNTSCCMCIPHRWDGIMDFFPCVWWYCDGRTGYSDFSGRVSLEICRGKNQISIRKNKRVRRLGGKKEGT